MNSVTHVTKMQIEKLTPAIGAVIHNVTGTALADPETQGDIYQALLDHLVIFIRGQDISFQNHFDFAASFGDLTGKHPSYPHVDGFEQIMVLQAGPDSPPDTDSWHTDMTFRAEQPFASVLVARQVPEVGGDTLWSSNYAAYDRLPEGMRIDLQTMQAVHDFGDFRNNFAADLSDATASDRLGDAVVKFGQTVRPLVDRHPITQRKFLNFNPAFVSHIVGMTTAQSDALKAWLTHHMNAPEDQMRWRWRNGDLAMWDNRVTMHYAVADYLPHPRVMNRITVIRDRRDKAHNSHA